MPEGDSVWWTARRLDRCLAGRRLLHSDLRVPRHATVDLAGRLVLGTDTHGKHLFTRFEGGVTLHTHLRMDGRWIVRREPKRPATEPGDEIRVLLESDQHQVAMAVRVPVVELAATAAEGRITERLGPDPLRPDWEADEAVRRLTADPSRPLAAALLDQQNLAGLGNLWVNEILFVRGHNPWLPAGEADLDRLVTLAARMLRQSIAVRGDGQVTTGDRRRGHQHWVYRRTGEACRRCGTFVRHERAQPAGPWQRETWWCPHCQPTRADARER